MNTRPMSFSDRQHFIQCLAETRNLSIACALGEHPDSELRRRCETLTSALTASSASLSETKAILL